MALEAKQASVCIKKILRLSIRKGYRFVSEHPILFGLGVLLYLLYRSSPGFFAFLLSSSPVIICTTVLLGILLSYGEVNLPEASEDHKGTSEISASRVGNSSSDVHFEANQRLSVPEFRENTPDFKERETKPIVSFRERASEHVDLDVGVPLLRRADEEEERGDWPNMPRTLTPFPSMVNLRQEGFGEDLTFNKKRESEGSFFMQDKADRQTTLFDGALLSGLNDKDTSFGLFPSSENVNKHVDIEENLNQLLLPDSAASKEGEISQDKQIKELAGTSKPAPVISVHQWEKTDGLIIDTSNAVGDTLLDSSLGSPWARVSCQDDSSGFDSDQAESSSPDASMTDIAPVLDEIDPLLGADSTRPDPIPKDDSDTDSHVSEDHQIDDDSNDEGDDNDAKDNVEGKKKDDGREAAFLWTADDEKNLMDLGYSEMERNRRLEILMARRRSRKNIRFEIDSNLIDVDSSAAGRSLDDLSRFRAQVPPIAVPRRNPFDLTYDSEEAAIPGSAPSILHARKNPFDLPLEQSNDIAAHDSLNFGESVTSPRRDMIFRRHESFNFGRTDAIQEKRFSRLKPYFVPETVEWNTSNFQRQFSDKSESKLSSVTESDMASSVADQEDHKDHDEKDLADVGSECSDGINSVDVELDNSDIDDREIALQHFVFERSQEREEHLASTKGKGHEEDYMLKSAGSSTMPFHTIPDLLSWEDGDGDNSLGAKPSFQLNTEVKCSEWVSSSRPTVEGESHSGNLPEYLDTGVASSSNTVVLGASIMAEKDGNVDLMSYSNNEMALDNLIHGSTELPSEFVTETLPVISRDLHPIPEERVVENFNMEEKHEAATFTDSAIAFTGLQVIEEHFDAGSNESLGSAVVSSYPLANDVDQPLSDEHAKILNPFVSMVDEPNKVDMGHMNDENAGYLLDSDDEAGKIYPEPLEDSGIDESFLSELDTVGDFGVQPMRLDQQVPDHGSHDDNPTNGVAAASVISPQTSDVSLTVLEASGEASREQPPLVDDLNDSEYSWSFGASHGDPEQTVYNPRRRILEASSFEAITTELKPPHDELELPSDDTASAGILAAASSELVANKHESMSTTTDPDMTILEAKSLEDIKSAFKLVSDGVVSEASKDTDISQILDLDVDSEPKEVTGDLHLIDAKSVDDIQAALKEHRDSVMYSSLEENKDKNGYGETAESTKHDELAEAMHAESPHGVGEARDREAFPVDSTSNMTSSEAKVHDGIDAVFNKVSDSSAKNTQVVESDDSCERGN